MNEEKKATLSKSSIKQCLISFVSIMLSALYMPLFMYMSNCDESSISEIWLPLVLFPVMAIVMLLIFLPFTKSMNKAAIIAVLMILMLENYQILETAIKKINSDLKYWHILPICIVLVLHLGYLVCRVLHENISKYIPFVVTIVFGGLILVNFVVALPAIIEKMTVSTKNSIDFSEESSDARDVDTNIYLFLLDEASSFKTLETYYDYDAMNFREFLEKNNFNISENSYNNVFPPSTVTILTDLINLDYIFTSAPTAAEMEAANTNSALRRYLKKNNYDLVGVGDTEWLSIPSLTAEKSSAGTIDGENLLQLTMKGTFLSPFFSTNTVWMQKVILDTMNFYDNKEIYLDDHSFKFTYLSCPHQPFIFDENGNDNNEPLHLNDWNDPKYYLNQYKFIMKITAEKIENIIKNDPDCVIMIMSDHGARSNMEIPSAETTNIINCLYYKGESVNIEGLSGVNTLITVLNKLFDDKMPLIEDIKYDTDVSSWR